MNCFMLIPFVVAVVTAQQCGRFVGDCTSLQRSILYALPYMIVAGYRPMYKVAVENNVVSKLYSSSRYYSSSECSDDPILVTTTIYDLEVTDRDVNYTASFVTHRGTVEDYLILSSNVDRLSSLGVSCVPALKNNVEVSVKTTTCTSTLGIISGKDVINSTSNVYMRFPKENTLQASTRLPYTTSEYSRLDAEGCVGCKKEGVWKAADIGATRYSFCEANEQGYVFRSCMLGKEGNGMWNAKTVSECLSVSDPAVATGDAWFRGKITIDMDATKFDAYHHNYIEQQLVREVKANGLAPRALTMEDVENVVTNTTEPKSGKPILVYFVVKGEYGNVKKAMTSIQSVMEKGIMHKALISYDSAFFDAKIDYAVTKELSTDNSLVVIIVLCAVVAVLVVGLIGSFLYFRLKEKKLLKKISRDVESGNESEYSYSSSSEYSYSSSEENELSH